jgi:hypothetical protein
MEHLWSRAGATGGKRAQIEWPQERLEQAKPVAVGCDRLPIGAHGKEGVNGSSPLEGFRFYAGERRLPLRTIKCVTRLRYVHSPVRTG